MYSRQTRLRPVETFLFGIAGQTYFNTGSPNVNITDSSTGNARLNNGQIGLFDSTGYGSNGINNSLATTNTLVHSPVAYFAAGLPKDAITGKGVNRPYPLWARPFERSADINGNNWILATSQPYTAPQYCTWVIGNPATATTGQINILDNTEYLIQVAQKSAYYDVLYSNAVANTSTASFVTPNYTALTAITSPVDHLVQNLAYNINRNSRFLNISNKSAWKGNSNVVAFAIGTSASAGVNIAALTNGQVVDVVSNVVAGGKLVMTPEIIATLQAAVNSTVNPAWVATTEIVPINLATAGSAASAAAGAQGIIIIELDRPLAFKDRIFSTKASLEVGLTAGFAYPSVYSKKTTSVIEGAGLPRMVDLQYKATHGQRIYNLNQTTEDSTSDPVIEFPSPVDYAVNYHQLIIEHADINQLDMGNVGDSPLKTIIAIPNTDGQMAAIISHLNTWLPGTGNVLVEATN